MLLFKKVVDLQKYLELNRKKGRSIGFAPTMGALHQGHLSLIEQAKAKKDLVVCSIFVNPTQFNEKSDLQRYPRTIEKDIDLLSSVNNDVLFLPSESEVYPSNLDTHLNLDFEEMAMVMEGKFRPGHFDGMAQVVKRLLDIVQPDHLYMGQKDFQQFSIVMNMLKQIDSKTKLVICPIIRELDGLAMSSRNVRLTKKQRKQAPLIHKTLLFIKENKNKFSPRELEQMALKRLEISEEFNPDYFEIVDGKTLMPFDSFLNKPFVVACTAVWVDQVRLIDNMIL